MSTSDDWSQLQNITGVPKDPDNPPTSVHLGGWLGYAYEAVTDPLGSTVCKIPLLNVVCKGAGLLLFLMDAPAYWITGSIGGAVVSTVGFRMLAGGAMDPTMGMVAMAGGAVAGTFVSYLVWQSQGGGAAGEKKFTTDSDG